MKTFCLVDHTEETQIWHLNVYILLAFSSCFLYLNENVSPCGQPEETQIWHLNVYILLAFSTCFLYLHENVLPCGLTNQRRYGFDIYMYRSRQSSCQSTIAVKPVKAVKLSRQLSCQSIQAVKAFKLSRQSSCRGSQAVITVNHSLQSNCHNN